MSHFIRFDGGANGDEPLIQHYGSATSVTQLTKWIKKYVDRELYPLLYEFGQKQSVKGTMDLSVELELAMDRYPIPPDTYTTLHTFLNFLCPGDDDETVRIANEDDIYEGFVFTEAAGYVLDDEDVFEDDDVESNDGAESSDDDRRTGSKE